MFNLVTISGSLRAASTNTAALLALARLSTADVLVTHFDQLGALPHFNPDHDGDGIRLPTAVLDLRNAVRHAQALLISSPEYAHGVPGVLKNALDWLVSSVDFPEKPVALLNISPISVYVHAQLSETLRTMSARLIEDPALIVPLPRRGLDAAGMLSDTTISNSLRAALRVVVERAQS